MQLRVAWWNTSLCPRRRQWKEVGDLKWGLAREVVLHLLTSVDGHDVLALAEVSRPLIERLLAATSSPSRYGYICDDAAGVAVVFDTQKALAPEETRITTVAFGKEVRAGVHVALDCLALDADARRVHLIASHWPSRMIPSATHYRAACGAQLHSQVRSMLEQDAAAAVMIVGDFNDEPFDISLTGGLQATRDRVAVQRNAHLLYNPFWRLLGERHDLEDGLPPRGAGTYWSSMSPESRWYTFDQALVSAPLVRGSGWTLCEKKTGVVALDMLRTDRGALRQGFDHYPISVTIRYQMEVSYERL